VVHTPDDRFLLDPKGKAAGRGAYVCPDPACLKNALKRKAFDRAFKQAVPKEAAAALEVEIGQLLECRAPGNAGEAAGESGD
jgi:uncharacterized protein